VVEVGAGLGSLTRELADAGAEEVLAIEFDRSLLPALREAIGSRTSVRVLHADATKVDWPSVLDGGSWILCANLPYNVGTSIILEVLQTAPMVHRLLVMVQREVGERLVASPASDAYGAVSVRVAYSARASLVRRVRPEVFWPRPSVGSVIVRLERLSAPPVAVDERRLWRVVDEAFGQRRKTMKNALRRLGLEPADADELLAGCAVDPAVRPEELGLDTFARIAEGLPR
jgi:16S rRNA (adenine1518-N6/adenine1519-N6)-dimethyltransferase